MLGLLLTPVLLYNDVLIVFDRVNNTESLISWCGVLWRTFISWSLKFLFCVLPPGVEVEETVSSVCKCLNGNGVYFSTVVPLDSNTL